MRWFFACALAAATTSNAAAEDRWRFAIGADAIYSIQDGQDLGQLVNNPSTTAPSLGGSAAGVNVSTQFRITRVFAVGIEASGTSRFEGVQIGRISLKPFKTDTLHRDVIVSGLIHAHWQAGHYLDFDFAAGAGPVFDSDLTRIAATDSFFAYLPYGPEMSISRTSFAATLGADVEIRLSNHVSVGPTARVHFINRADPGIVGRGLGSVVFRTGAGVRVMF